MRLLFFTPLNECLLCCYVRCEDSLFNSISNSMARFLQYILSVPTGQILVNVANLTAKESYLWLNKKNLFFSLWFHSHTLNLILVMKIKFIIIINSYLSLLLLLLLKLLVLFQFSFLNFFCITRKEQPKGAQVGKYSYFQLITNS